MTLKQQLDKISPMRVRVTTDPYPFGDAPINSFHTFAALLNDARPKLHITEDWSFSSDERSDRQREAEALVYEQAGRVGVEVDIENLPLTADERLDQLTIALAMHFNVGDWMRG